VTLRVARATRTHDWVGVAGSADNEEPGWQELPQEDLD
jgi:hypothetical protein